MDDKMASSMASSMELSMDDTVASSMTSSVVDAMASSMDEPMVSSMASSMDDAMASSMDQAILSFMDGSEDIGHGRPHHVIVPSLAPFHMPWRNDEFHVPFHEQHHSTSRQMAGLVTYSMFLDGCTPLGVSCFVPWCLLYCVVTCLNDLSNRGIVQSGRLDGIVKEDVDNAATNTGLDVPGSSSWLEVYIQMTQFLYLGSVVHESADLLFEIAQLVPHLRVCLEPFGSFLYDMTTAQLV